MLDKTSTTAALALDVKPSTVVYKKTTLKSDYMKCPANAIAIGKFGPNKGKLILACGSIDTIAIMDVASASQRG
jgi:hypothetical protein